MIRVFFFLLSLSVLSPCKVGAEDTAVPVKIQPLTKQAVTVTVTAWGQVEEAARRLFMERAGMLTELGADTGDRVVAGQVLARLDTTIIENRRQVAEFNLRNARNKLSRTRKLKRTDVVGQDRLDDVINDHAVKQLAFEQAEEEYQKHFLRAPTAGWILERRVDHPGPVTTATPLFVFKAEAEPWAVTVKLADRHLTTLQPGQPAEVFLDDAPAIPGKITRIARAADPGDPLYAVKIALRDPPKTPRAGQQARARLALATVEGYPVPLNAFHRLDGTRGELYVTADDHQQARRVPVAFTLVNGTDAVVTTDLSAYHALIVAGRQHLKDGSRIQVIE